MKITHVVKSSQRASADVVIIPVWEGKKKGEIACGEVFDEKAWSDAVRFSLDSGDFCGKEGETLLLYFPDGKERRAFLLGLGKKKECSTETLRRAYGKCALSMREKKLESVNLLLPEWNHCSIPAFEGIVLGSYSFDQLKEQSIKEESYKGIKTLCFCGISAKEHASLEKTEIVLAAIKMVRDLVNRNADDTHVGTLTKVAKELEKRANAVKTVVLDKKQLEHHKMGLLLAVGQGAARDPALIIIEYKGDPKSKDSTAIIGKGITFDTGGLNLKPTGGIETMKCDMAGAATTLGIMQAAIDLKLKVNVIGVLAVAENAIGPHSYKPGDVYRSHAGITVEISNTDAEGRLVLADAFSYIQEKYTPSRMIDLATLTGGIVVALGEEATGLFSNNEALAKGIEKAAEKTDERVWRMPLYPEYKAKLKSPIADLKNAAGRPGSSCTAAAFLHRFIRDDTPWAHLDIAGTAYLSEPSAYNPYLATGVGVRLLTSFLEHECT